MSGVAEERGYRTTAHISEAEKVEFLGLVYQGLNRQEAANALGYKGTDFRSLCSPKSPFFDEDFKVSYDEALGSFEHAENYLERLNAEANKRGLMDSDRLLEKLLIVHDPRWREAFQTKRESNVNIAVLVQQQLKQLPTETIQQILSLIETGETIEDAEIQELPPAA